jgi:Flp pilus assembly protein CpaB
MARNRSTILIAIGAAVFVLGSTMAFLLVRKDKASSPPPAATATVPAKASLTAATATAPTPAVSIPDGMEAIAVQLPFVPGGGGYVHAGDDVNIFGIFKTDQPASAPKAPLAKLALSNVKVLSVTSPAPGVDNGAATYLLAVTSSQAEQLAYLTTFQSLYMTLTRKGAPLASTPGHNVANAL